VPARGNKREREESITEKMRKAHDPKSQEARRIVPSKLPGLYFLMPLKQAGDFPLHTWKNLLQLHGRQQAAAASGKKYWEFVQEGFADV
jgi:hypothetical protein